MAKLLIVGATGGTVRELVREALERGHEVTAFGHRNLVRAMEREGVRRLVCETSLGVGDSFGRMGLYTLFVGVTSDAYLRQSPGVAW